MSVPEQRARLVDGWTLVYRFGPRPKATTTSSVELVVTTTMSGELVEVEVPPQHEALADVIFDGLQSQHDVDNVSAVVRRNVVVDSSHHYLSTSCLHELHERCASKGAHCKHCPARCVCSCHASV